MSVSIHFAIILLVTAFALSPTYGFPAEARGGRRRSSFAPTQETVNQPSFASNTLTGFGSQESGLAFGSAEGFTNRHNETRQRNKEMRLLAIKDMVLSQLGRQNKAPPQTMRMSPPDIITRLNGEVPSSPFSGELQTFLASCELPNKVGQETWTMPGFFHLFFNVSSGVASPNSPQIRTSKGVNSYPEYYPVTGRQSKKPINVLSAKLRLYKIGRGSQSNDLLKPRNMTEPCNDTIAEGIETLSSQINKTPALVDEKIRVSIYWYTMPATRHHYKKKLLDTKMLSIKESEWVDFDIQKAVKAWLDKKLNYGLSVEVENEDNDLVDAKDYFSNIACPEPTAEAQMNRTQPNVADFLAPPEVPNPTTPTLEICTLSIANSGSSFTDGDQQPAYPPFPFPVASLRTHNKQYQETRAVEEPSWQNDGLADQPMPSEPNHRHRHHHGESQSQLSKFQRHQRLQTRTPSQGQKGDTRQILTNQAQNDETPTELRFDENHPLRSIFATPFRSSRRKSSLRGTEIKHLVEDLDYSHLESSEEEKEHEGQKIVIENLFIEPQGSGRTR